jgi:hypothetical protein
MRSFITRMKNKTCVFDPWLLKRDVACGILGWSLAKEIPLYRKRWIESRSSWRQRPKVRNGYVPVSGMATGVVADNGRTAPRFIFGRLGLFGVQQAVRPVIASVATSYLPDSPLAVGWPLLDHRSFGKQPASFPKGRNMSLGLNMQGTWALYTQEAVNTSIYGQMSCHINHTKFWLQHLCSCTTSR